MPTEKSLPTVTLPESKVKRRGTLKTPWGDFGVQRPNALLAQAVIGHEDEDGKPTMNVAYMKDYIVGHIVPDEREAFLAGALGYDGLDGDYLGELMEALNEIAYGEVPSQP